MNFRLFRIPLAFFVIGVLWALFSHVFITYLGQGYSHQVRELLRGANHIFFFGLTTVVLYYQIKREQDKLAASADQYRNLFERNPNPMWIFRNDNLRFVKVNKAAVNLYGYSESEFLAMSVKDIRPEKEKERFMINVKSLEPGLSDQGIWKHVTRNGDMIYASIATCDIEFDNQDCRLVMANDITDAVMKEDCIRDQNSALHEIAWLNSHEVRKSLCSVISLIELLKETNNELERRQYIEMLEQCTGELDDILIRTNRRVDELKMYDKPKSAHAN